MLAKTPVRNTRKAFEVFERATAPCWTFISTFDSGACGVESAAADLGYSAGDGTVAFTAVGLSRV